MNIKIMRPKIHLLLFVLFCFSVSVFSQTKSDDEKLLQGKWVLEDISFLQINGKIHTSINSVANVEVYTEIGIRGDSISLVYNENTQETKFTIESNFIKFDSRPIPFCAEWVMFENKLYMEQILKDSFDESKKIIVTSIYRRKSVFESIYNKKNIN